MTDMTSSWPTVISAPLVCGIWVLWGIRMVGFHATVYARRANLLLAGLAVAATLREPTWQGWVYTLSGGCLSVATQFQLAMAVMIAVAGVNVLTLRAVLGRATSPYLVVGLGLSCAVTTMISGAHARAAGVMIEQDVGWGAVGYWASLLPLTWWMAVLLVEVCLVELRGRTDPRDLALLGAGLVFLVILFAGFTCAPIAAVYQIAGRHTVFARIQQVIDRDVLLWQAVLFAVLVAIPVLLRAAEWLELDNHSRSRKRLLPLWADLTATCPEVVYTGPVIGSRRSRFLLHRTVIEIRDSVRILAGYDVPQEQAHRAVVAGLDPTMVSAVRLARACRARRTGVTRCGRGMSMIASTGGVDAEIAELTALAECWARAQIIAARSEAVGQSGMSECGT
ncbi:hypothetical protein F5X71_02565 [Nocardia brasiliensis]|uniref:DUF6545 domain-containing protein n=1 Tax=Nocardia brasiliensis TaxID=37326 RepID=A0A6G9XK84_NOCBR|nr:DUF6545 domain-containing protein [Nocardia brasiliensis]QIS01341.1 hypothetical protein F5X71_02565 [Nocardia brasiliensis]